MKPENKSDVRDQIKAIAEGMEIDPDKAAALAQKCYEDVYWRPYGGATSFREIDQMEATRDYSYKVDTETYKLRAIVENITETDDLGIDDKVSAIQAAAGDFKTRVREIPIDPGIKEGFWTKMVNKITGKKSEPEIEELGGDSFKVFRNKATGETRWVSFSSNAFEDLDKELFTTAALEEAVAYADKTGERGPICVFHVEESAFGQCDFQGIQGRFLIESGTFDDTDLGRTAEKYFSETNKEWQVSIGFKYRAGDELDGMYDWFRFRERSVCPMGTAANPYTDFGIFGGNKEVDERKIATLTEIFGEDRAKRVLATAEEKTKELEEANIRHKELKEGEEISEEKSNEVLKALAEKLGMEPEKVIAAAKAVAADSEKGSMEDDEEDDEDEDKSKEAPTPSVDMDKLAALIVDMANTVDAQGKQIGELVGQMKALQEEDDEKISRLNTPRGQQAVRPSADEKTLVEQAMQIAAKAETGDKSNDPASPYVDDLIKNLFPAAANS